MALQTADRSSARERLLAAASALFYEEGVRTVGIDRVIERAGVAKATLYNAFGSKDELIRAYLAQRHALWKEHMAHELAANYDTPRERLLGVFDVLGSSFTEPGFRGCAFVNACAETPPGSPIEEVSGEFRAWRQALLAELAGAAGARDPESIAFQLGMVYDGASVAAHLDRNSGAASGARAVAAALIDAAIDS